MDCPLRGGLCAGMVDDGAVGDMKNDKLWQVNAGGRTVVYAWMPQPDITAYELALCMPALSGVMDSGTKGHGIDELPNEARRHFAKVSP